MLARSRLLIVLCLVSSASACTAILGSFEKVSDVDARDSEIADAANDAQADATVDSSIDDTSIVDTADTALQTETPLTDSSDVSPDTFVLDTSMADTFVPDTSMADTFVPDTSMPDTFVPDTSMPDTFVPDTFMPDVCPKTLCGGACVDTNTDPNNCGGCGSTCDSSRSLGRTCSGGSCFYGGCVSGYDNCSATAPDRDGCETMLNTTSNCGACGNVCGTGMICSGTCVCPSGTSLCGGICVALNTTSNCGMCGRVCPPTASCTGAMCVCPASAPTECGGACVNTGSNFSHCGMCDRPCDGGKSCFSGTCACPVGFTDCGAEGCADLSSDPRNCNGCGLMCTGATPSCIGGVCSGSPLGDSGMGPG